MTCCGHTGLTRFLRTERCWFTPTHDAVLLKKAFKVGAWAEIDRSGQISARARAKGFLPGWLMHLPDGVGKVGRRGLIEQGLDTIHKLKNATKIQVQHALGYEAAGRHLRQSSFRRKLAVISEMHEDCVYAVAMVKPVHFSLPK